MRVKIKKENLYLSLIIILGFILRMVPVLNNGFWHDEACSFFISGENSIKELTLGADPVHPPLYYFLIKFWSKLNTSILFLRVPSVVFSLVSIFLVFKIAESLGVNSLYGFLSSLLFSFSAFQIDYAWQARMYTLELLLILLSIYFLIPLLTTKNTQHLFFFVFSNILGFLADYGFVWYLLSLHVAFLALNVLSLLKYGPWKALNRKGLLVGLLLSDFLILFYVPVTIKVFSKALDSVAWIEFPTFNILQKTIYFFFGFADKYGPKINTLYSIPATFLITSIFYFLKTDDKKLIRFFLFLILLSFALPLFLSFQISKTLRSSIFLDRNLIVASLFPIFTTGVLISKLLVHPKHHLNLLGVLSLAVFLFLNLNLYINRISGLYTDRRSGKRYKQVADFLKRRANLEEELLIFLPKWRKIAFDYYFFNYYKNKKPNTPSYQLGSEEFLFNTQTGQVLGAQPGRVYWIIIPEPDGSDASILGGLKNLPTQCLTKDKSYEFAGAVVYRCELKTTTIKF